MAAPPVKDQIANPDSGDFGVYEPSGSSPITIARNRSGWVINTNALSPTSVFRFQLPGGDVKGMVMLITNVGNIDTLEIARDPGGGSFVFPGGIVEQDPLVLPKGVGGAQGSTIHLVGFNTSGGWRVQGVMGEIILTGLLTSFWGTVEEGTAQVVWEGQTTDESGTEIFLRGVTDSRFVLPPNKAAKVDVQIIAIDSAYRGKSWEVHAFIYRGGASNTSQLNNPLYVTLLQTEPDEFRSETGNNLGNGTIVCKEASGSVPGSGTVWINGDPYAYVSISTAPLTFILSGTLSQSYSENDQIQVSTGGWDVLVDADDTNESVRIRVFGEPGTDINWKAVGSVGMVDIPAAP